METLTIGDVTGIVTALAIALIGGAVLVAFPIWSPFALRLVRAVPLKLPFAVVGAVAFALVASVAVSSFWGAVTVAASVGAVGGYVLSRLRLPDAPDETEDEEDTPPPAPAVATPSRAELLQARIDVAARAVQYAVAQGWVPEGELTAYKRTVIGTNAEHMVALNKRMVELATEGGAFAPVVKAEAERPPIPVAGGKLGYVDRAEPMPQPAEVREDDAVLEYEAPPQ